MIFLKYKSASLNISLNFGHTKILPQAVIDNIKLDGENRDSSGCLEAHSGRGGLKGADIFILETFSEVLAINRWKFAF